MFLSGGYTNLCVPQAWLPMVTWPPNRQASCHIQVSILHFNRALCYNHSLQFNISSVATPHNCLKRSRSLAKTVCSGIPLLSLSPPIFDSPMADHDLCLLSLGELSPPLPCWAQVNPYRWRRCSWLIVIVYPSKAHAKDKSRITAKAMRLL